MDRRRKERGGDKKMGGGRKARRGIMGKKRRHAVGYSSEIYSEVTDRERGRVKEGMGQM